MPDADFRLVLSHSPDLVPKAARWGIDLMLSGHNHGGQVRLPVIGPVFMPSLYSRRFDRDFFRTGPTLLHVSQGVAGQAPDPLRLRARDQPAHAPLGLSPPAKRARGWSRHGEVLRSRGCSKITWLMGSDWWRPARWPP